MITLFHGSEKIIEKPFYGGSKPYNDYGSGFYCTENADLAREWSVDSNRDGFVNHYICEEDGLTVLRLNDGSYSILNWLSILLENRKFQTTARLAREAKRYILTEFSVPYKEADMIVGYRADDSYFAFANDFLNGTITLSQLEEAMFLGKLGEHIVLKSEESYRRIHFIDYEPTDAGIWYPRRQKRDAAARKQYFRQDRDGWTKGELYMPRFLDEEIKANDPRIRRIVY
ncbi:MAG: DUF3990 domain-containing protein [Eubacterium sp.]|nr:DUF3990 domain-containing protein [Eubacterium sp.]